MTNQRDPRIREAVTRLALASPPAPTFDDLTEDQVVSDVRRVPARATVAIAAIGVLVVIGGASVLLGGSEGATESSPVARSTTTAPTSTTIPEVSTTIIDPPVAIEQWSPVLSERIAATPPPAAVCPTGTDADAIGPADQPRPWGAAWSNQAGVFDQHAGKVLFVDERGDLWAFDVCVNTWHELVVSPSPGELMLVYDADSDVTVGFGTGSVWKYDAWVWIYDANTNEATLREMPPEYAVATPGLGAIYDPISGLVVLQTDTSGLVAYDADSNTWTPLGKVVDDGGYGPYLVGYAEETDRLVLVDLSQQTGQGQQAGKGWLVDPRTGDSVAFTGPENGFFAGFGRLNYATTTSTPFVVDGNRICRLDSTIPAWNCVALADGPGDFDDDGSGSGLLAAIVDDASNNRTLLIYGYGPGFNGARYYDVNDIWAIGHEDTHWTHLLPATGPMTLENDG